MGFKVRERRDVVWDVSGVVEARQPVASAPAVAFDGTAEIAGGPVGSETVREARRARLGAVSVGVVRAVDLSGQVDRLNPVPPFSHLTRAQEVVEPQLSAANGETVVDKRVYPKALPVVVQRGAIQVVLRRRRVAKKVFLG